MSKIMKQGDFFMIFPLLTCAAGIHASPKLSAVKPIKATQKQAAKFMGSIPHEPVQLVGRWSLVKKNDEGTDNGCFLTIRSDHTLTILTGGLEADLPYTMIWMQEGNRIHFICPVVNQDYYGTKPGLDSEHLQAMRANQGEWVREGFRSGLSIFEYRGHILLIPEGELGKSDRPDYPVGWSFTRGNVVNWNGLFSSHAKRP